MTEQAADHLRQLLAQCQKSLSSFHQVMLSIGKLLPPSMCCCCCCPRMNSLTLISSFLTHHSVLPASNENFHTFRHSKLTSLLQTSLLTSNDIFVCMGITNHINNRKQTLLLLNNGKKISKAASKSRVHTLLHQKTNDGGIDRLSRGSSSNGSKQTPLAWR
jgi:hypothetical protein